MFQFKNIIVPTDFSELSYTAFPFARDIADKYQANLHVIHVLDDNPNTAGFKYENISKEELLKKLTVESENKLAESLAYFGDDIYSPVITMLKYGEDYKEIIKYSQEINSELIVIATHGRSGLVESVLGSVAQKVIRHAKCPVLVTTPEGILKSS